MNAQSSGAKTQYTVALSPTSQVSEQYFGWEREHFQASHWLMIGGFKKVPCTVRTGPQSLMQYQKALGSAMQLIAKLKFPNKLGARLKRVEFTITPRDRAQRCEWCLHVCNTNMIHNIDVL